MVMIEDRSEGLIENIWFLVAEDKLNEAKERLWRVLEQTPNHAQARRILNELNDTIRRRHGAGDLSGSGN